MKQPENVSGQIQVLGDCAYYRPAGTSTLEQAVDLLDEAIAYARDHRVPKLLFNAKALVGFRSPSLPERYFISRRWAETGRGLVRVAMVIRAELIDPQKFGVTVARNSGMDADVFAEESEALDWLLSEPGKAN